LPQAVVVVDLKAAVDSKEAADLKEVADLKGAADLRVVVSKAADSDLEIGVGAIMDVRTITPRYYLKSHFAGMYLDWYFSEEYDDEVS
jgi:hypothetical protein